MKKLFNIPLFLTMRAAGRELYQICYTQQLIDIEEIISEKPELGIQRTIGEETVLTFKSGDEYLEQNNFTSSLNTYDPDIPPLFPNSRQNTGLFEKNFDYIYEAEKNVKSNIGRSTYYKRGYSQSFKNFLNGGNDAGYHMPDLESFKQKNYSNEEIDHQISIFKKRIEKIKCINGVFYEEIEEPFLIAYRYSDEPQIKPSVCVSNESLKEFLNEKELQTDNLYRVEWIIGIRNYVTNIDDYIPIYQCEIIRPDLFQTSDKLGAIYTMSALLKKTFAAKLLHEGEIFTHESYRKPAQSYNESISALMAKLDNMGAAPFAVYHRLSLALDNSTPSKPDPDLLATLDSIANYPEPLYESHFAMTKYKKPVVSQSDIHHALIEYNNHNTITLPQLG